MTSKTKEGAAQAAPSLNELAVLIREESKAGEEADLARALRLGGMLRQAHDQVPRGTWQAWVKKNYAGSYATAARQRQLADPSNLSRVRDCKSVREALAAIAKPKPTSETPKKKRVAGSRLRKLHAMKRENDSMLLGARIDVMKMVGILEGIDFPTYGVGDADRETISDIHAELLILAEWLDRSLDLVAAEMDDIQRQETIRKLREGMNGRTDAEMATALRLADKLERKRSAIRG